MEFIDEKATPRYQNQIQGAYGSFTSSAGTVEYLLTKARLGKGGIDNERRLTTKLRPVREILDIEKVDFNQVLQRALDDHRVATELIPYVLEPEETGPAFFPPLIAVVLPFEANEPVEDFPPAEPDKIVHNNNMPFLTERYGRAFQVQRLSHSDESLHHLNVGRLEWNDEKCKLVVIDGQHRAMALLAIDRTVNGTWDSEGGGKYRYFYEHRVKRILSNKEIDLDAIEFPVNICWFPQKGLGSPHKAARKLFVDLNREARQPSEARLILLSDRELSNVFSRAILNELRSESSSIPVYAVEYDNPDESHYQPVRWSVVTNLHLVKYAIQYSLFCPPKYLHDMDARFGGRLPESKMDARMRRQLNLHDIMQEKVDEGDVIIERSSVGNDFFPQSKLKEITSNFMGSWGSSIIHLFEHVSPYRAHCNALEKLKEDWIRDDATSSLAYEALFAGMGMYWTLRDSHQHWQERKRELRAQGKQVPSKPDIVKAWDIIDKKGADFEAHRAFEYLGSSTETRQSETKALYNVLNTHACQLGAVLALATLTDAAGFSGAEVSGLSKKICEAWSKAFESEVNPSRNRRLIFAKDEGVISHPLNRVSKMDTPIAVYFRYFWLELLCLAPAVEVIGDSLDTKTLRELRDKARVNYLRYLIKEQVKALKRGNPEWGEHEFKDRAVEIESGYLSKALSFWFEIEQKEFDTWYEAKFAESAGDNEEYDELEDDGIEATVDSGDEIGDDVDSILKEIQ